MKPPAARALPLAALLLLPTAVAEAAAGRWSLAVGGVWFSPAGASFTADRAMVLEGAPAPGDDRSTHTVDADGTGFALALGYRLAPRWSVEAGALFADLDNDFRLVEGGVALTDTEAMGVEVFFAGVDWHPATDGRLDPTLGVFVAETSFEDVTFLTEAGRREKLAFDDDYGFGVKLGADWRLAGAWYLSAEARYLWTIMESEVAGEDLDLDPLIVGVGVGWRF